VSRTPPKPTKAASKNALNSLLPAVESSSLQALPNATSPLVAIEEDLSSKDVSSLTAAPKTQADMLFPIARGSALLAWLLVAYSSPAAGGGALFAALVIAAFRRLLISLRGPMTASS
jgi:hypothetical protein